MKNIFIEGKIILCMIKVKMPQDYFLLKDYMERLNDIQNSYSAITLYPEVNNKKFSKLEEEIKEK